MPADPTSLAAAAAAAGKSTTSRASETESMVNLALDRVLRMINEFEIKPGERLNEVAIARQLGVSRTPLREALNRLAIEGFLTTRPAKGFFCREIRPRDVFELFQLRGIIETGGVRLAVRHGTEEEIDALHKFLIATAELKSDSIESLVHYDETFHEGVLRMARNSEMSRVLHNVNLRIRPIRWIDLNRRGRQGTQAEHQRILAAIRARDGAEAARLMDSHIARRQDVIETSIRQLFGEIYVSLGTRRERP